MWHCSMSCVFQELFPNKCSLFFAVCLLALPFCHMYYHYFRQLFTTFPTMLSSNIQEGDMNLFDSIKHGIVLLFNYNSLKYIKQEQCLWDVALWQKDWNRIASENQTTASKKTQAQAQNWASVCIFWDKHDNISRRTEEVMKAKPRPLLALKLLFWDF